MTSMHTIAAIPMLPSGSLDATRWILQNGVSVDIVIGNPFQSVVGSAVGAFLSTLIVGAIMIAVVPGYTERTMERVLDDPVGSFLYGIVCTVFLVVVTIVLFITLIGIFLAIPLAFLSYVVWAVGSAIAFLAIADRLVGHEDGWIKPLLVGAGINGILTLTGIGGILTFCIGAAGFGAVLRDYLN